MLHAVAPAKINLYLHITGKREDGYHLLDSLVVFADTGDEITVAPADDVSLSIEGEFASAVGNDEDNLVLRAARLLQQDAKVPTGAAITLTKHLPVAAGLGGGSSDAATTLKLLSQLWGLSYTVEALSALALPLGSDLPVCLYAQPAFMSGIGDVVDAALATPPLYMLLVNPRKGLSTPDVYGAYVHEERQSEPLMLGSSLIASLKDMRNDLQRPAISLCSKIGEVLLELDTQINCEVARLCGSGATCYGLFSDKASCERAADTIRREHPDWWLAPVSI